MKINDNRPPKEKMLYMFSKYIQAGMMFSNINGYFIKTNDKNICVNLETGEMINIGNTALVEPLDAELFVKGENGI